ncbi:hypothetical protein [Agromyces sp. Marseille-Q5079]|uniref:hypothetical protein n=1 Tax=Agromyces sp. Marseille-Q5079 TaxID=3439059 RepID=UPI003D9CA649
MNQDPFLVAFLPQLFATLAGALIGVLAAWLAFTWQRRASNEDSVDRAVEDLLRRIGEYVADIDAYQKHIALVNWGAGQRPQRTAPHPASVTIAVELLRMKTKGKHRKVADEISKTWKAASSAELEKRTDSCGYLAAAITDWRLGASPAETADGMATARQLAVKNGELETEKDEV